MNQMAYGLNFTSRNNKLNAKVCGTTSAIIIPICPLVLSPTILTMIIGRLIRQSANIL